MNTFARAAHWLEDYVEVFDSCVIGDGNNPDDRRNKASRDEIAALALKLRELDGTYQKQVLQSPARNAAEIIASIIREWKVPGAVCFTVKTRRFRLVGTGYHPVEGEIWAGVYLPDVTADMLAEDFAFLTGELSCQ